MRSVPWFIAYVLLVVLSGPTGGKDVAHAALPPPVTAISFVMNTRGVSAIIFFLLKYFVEERDRVMAALEKEHRQVRHSLSLAMEVQQNLHPKADPTVNALDIAVKSVYCDETGGDKRRFGLYFNYYPWRKDLTAINGCEALTTCRDCLVLRRIMGVRYAISFYKR
jgi:hypothetical protein